MESTTPAPAVDRGTTLTELLSDVRALNALLNKLQKSEGKFIPEDQATLESLIVVGSHIQTKVETLDASTLEPRTQPRDAEEASAPPAPDYDNVERDYRLEHNIAATRDLTTKEKAQLADYRKHRKAGK